MKIKSAKAFRSWYKTNEKQHNKNDKTYDEDFAGCYHYAEDGKTILHKGFFEMFHGHKPDIENFLRVTLKMAEDSQAIFEFLQNAVDCGSSHFYTFYNEKYLLILNNGKPFVLNGLKSLLNLAQSDKKDATLIGRLGVGFKLVHRLVGKNDGVDEMIDSYKGPIMASWSQISDLEELRNNPTIELSEEFEDTSKLPFLLKIIATNFLANPGEEVYDIKYKPFIPFPLDELEEMSDYLNTCLEDIDIEGILNTGSLFFIKLGDGKYDLLNEVSGDIISGIQYSMNTLGSLTHVYINNEQVGKVELKMEEGKVKKGTPEFIAISPEYKEFDINYSVGYNIIGDFDDENSYIHVDELKRSPSFYKYFPMGDERHGLALFLHSDSFSIQTNRRKLNEDVTNKNLLPEIAKFLCARLDEYKENDREAYKQLYANLLLSDMPKDNSPWLKEAFYQYFKDYLKNNIPVEDGYCDNPNVVKIRQTKNRINLRDLGIYQHWFEWTSERMAKAARDGSNLALRNWNILDVIFYADLDKFNAWIANLSDEDYQILLKDIEEHSTVPESQLNKLKSIKLFKFSDDKFYSYLDIVRRKRSFDSKLSELIYSDNRIFKTNALSIIDDQLESFGFITSQENLSRFPNLSRIMPLPKVKEMTELMRSRRIIFCHCMQEMGSIEYSELQIALSNVFDLKTPAYEYINKTTAWHALFESDNKLGECKLKGNDAKVEDVLTLIYFCRKNNEHFFEHFVILDEKDGQCTIGTKSDRFKQFCAKGRLANLAQDYSSDLYQLPKSFLRDNIDKEPGIIGDEELQSMLIESWNFSEIKEELAFAISSPFRKKYLKRLDVLRVNLDKPITSDSFEYRVMEMACKYYTKRENIYNRGDFQDKIEIISNGKKYEVTTELLGQRDSFEISGKRFSMNVILPESDRNTGLVDLMIEKFVEAGLNRQELNFLIDINDDVDIEDLYNRLRLKYTLLRNAQQLAFVLLCNKVFNYNLDGFKVRTIDGSVYGLKEKFLYFTGASFIPDSCTLSWDYKGLTKYINLPVGKILDGPYIKEERIYYPGLSLEEWNEEKAYDLLTIIYQLWLDNPYQVKHANISTIDNYAVESCLKVDPRKIVCPNTYALSKETLPNYMEGWIQDYDDGMKFLLELGLQGPDSATVELRRYLHGDKPNLDREKYNQCNFAQLYFTVEWFCEKGLMATDEKMFKLIKDISERLEAYWNKQKQAPIEESFDVNTMKKNSKEWNVDKYKAWKQTTNISVWLYNGPMLHVLKIGKDKYPFYRYQEGDYYDDGYDIYINNNVDIETMLKFIASTGKKVLNNHNLASLNKSEVILLQSNLYNAEKRIRELEEEVKRLKDEIRKLKGGDEG